MDLSVLWMQFDKVQESDTQAEGPSMPLVLGCTSLGKLLNLSELLFLCVSVLQYMVLPRNHVRKNHHIHKATGRTISLIFNYTAVLLSPSLLCVLRLNSEVD